MSHNGVAVRHLARVDKLAEFRFQLRRFLNFSEMQADHFGIATQQYQLMQVVGAVPPGQTASISYLAERMVLRHNSAVELVDRAERAGLVQRTNDQSDGRRSIVVLTPRGTSVLESMVEAHLREIDAGAGRQILDALSDVLGSPDAAEYQAWMQREA